MLKRVKNKNIVEISALPDSDEVFTFYVRHGIPEERAGFITQGYKVKLSLLQDFQNGKTISYYHESHKII